jgi:hypothetical protein
MPPSSFGTVVPSTLGPEVNQSELKVGNRYFVLSQESPKQSPSGPSGGWRYKKITWDGNAQQYLNPYFFYINDDKQLERVRKASLANPPKLPKLGGKTRRRRHKLRKTRHRR